MACQPKSMQACSIRSRHAPTPVLPTQRGEEIIRTFDSILTRAQATAWNDQAMDQLNQVIGASVKGAGGPYPGQPAVQPAPGDWSTDSNGDPLVPGPSP